MDGAMKGLVDGLDPDTSYLTPDEVRVIDAKTPPAGWATSASSSAASSISALSASATDRRHSAPGLQTGDFIRAINDAATRDMSEFTGDRLLRGAPGSKVTLLIIRNGNTGDPRPVELVARSAETRSRDGQAPAGRRERTCACRASGRAPRPLEDGRGLNGRHSHRRPHHRRARRRGWPASRRDRRREALRENGTIAIRAGRPTTPVAKTTSSALPGATLDRPAAPGAVSSPTVAAAQPAPPAIPDNAVKTVAEAGDGALTMPVVLLVSNGTAHAAEVFAAALGNNKRATARRRTHCRSGRRAEAGAAARGARTDADDRALSPDRRDAHSRPRPAAERARRDPDHRIRGSETPDRPRAGSWRAQSCTSPTPSTTERRRHGARRCSHRYAANTHPTARSSAHVDGTFSGTVY